MRFDVGIPGITDIWVIDRASDILHDKMVLWSGNIDGWDFHENGVSSKELSRIVKDFKVEVIRSVQ